MATASPLSRLCATMAAAAASRASCDHIERVGSISPTVRRAATRSAIPSPVLFLAGRRPNSVRYTAYGYVSRVSKPLSTPRWWTRSASAIHPVSVSGPVAKETQMPRCRPSSTSQPRARRNFGDTEGSSAKGIRLGPGGPSMATTDPNGRVAKKASRAPPSAGSNTALSLTERLLASTTTWRRSAPTSTPTARAPASIQGANTVTDGTRPSGRSFVLVRGAPDAAAWDVSMVTPECRVEMESR